MQLPLVISPTLRKQGHTGGPGLGRLSQGSSAVHGVEVG